MIFAKIKDDLCVGTLVFDTKEEAMSFNNSLVEVKDGYGIGDYYKDGEWSHTGDAVQESLKEEVNRIKTRLLRLDVIVNRATEKVYTDLNLVPHESVKEVIDKKEELRKELRELEAKLEELKKEVQE